MWYHIRSTVQCGTQLVFGKNNCAYEEHLSACYSSKHCARWKWASRLKDELACWKLREQESQAQYTSAQIDTEKCAVLLHTTLYRTHLLAYLNVISVTSYNLALVTYQQCSPQNWNTFQCNSCPVSTTCFQQTLQHEAKYFHHSVIA